MPISIPSNTLDKFTSFGDLLRFLRRRVSLTQMELANTVGYSHTQISRLEQNLRLPDILTIEAGFICALGLEEEPKAVARLLELAANVRREDAPAPGLCPYKGLNFYDESDADLFVGREALTAHLVERILSMTSYGEATKERFLAVVGASGSGKSSLIRAGLVPTLRWNKTSADWVSYVFTPTEHPLESLALTLTQENGASTPTLVHEMGNNTHALREFASFHPGWKRKTYLVLVVDKFEELFALCRSEEERTSFIDNLLTASSDADSLVIVIITLRADFYAHCANYPSLREALARRQEYIGAMNNEELRRAIEEPAQRGRWEFEPGLVDLLLHDVGHEPGNLPLLSHALLETWQRRRNRMMTLSGYTSSSGVRGAIAETAETVFTDQFTREQQTIARRIFLRLTELSDETSTADTRRRATFNELILKPKKESSTHAVLSALADARLITTSEDAAEVAHAALIREWPTLRNWLEENRDGLHLHRQLTEAAQEWNETNRSEDMLYRGVRLAQSREWALAHKDEMNTLESEFLAASIEASERQAAEREVQSQRELEAAQKLADTEKKKAEEQTYSANHLQARNRIVTAFGAIVLVLFVLAAVFGIQSNQNADQAKANFTRSEAQRLAAEANNIRLSNGDANLIALLTIQSLKLQYTSAGDAELTSLSSLEIPPRVFSGHTNIVWGVAFSPDGKYLASGSSDGTARLWDLGTGETIHIFEAHAGEVGEVAFSPDGKYLLAGSTGGAHIWDIASGELARAFPDLKRVDSVAFSSDSKYIITSSFIDKNASFGMLPRVRVCISSTVMAK